MGLVSDISIDCGSSSSHTDAGNRTWVGDTDFVSTGLSSKIESTGTADYLTTLRYFPTGETNCYANIPVDKGAKVLVRTRFYYGNYNEEYKPPRFDVVYDGKHRDTIHTTAMDVDLSEAIYVSESGNISVCFVRTFMNEHPFVSTIEVRSLDASMYTDLGPKEGYILQRRFAYGRKELVRSPFDPYDRFWVEPSPDFPVTVLTSAAVSINTTKSENRPPEVVLRTSWSEKDMTFYDIKLPFTGVTFYLVMYFSEPISLSSDQKRSFYVYYDKKQVGSSLVVPPFGAVTQTSLRDVMMSSNPYLEFKATPDSNLPPLINALELYVVSNSDGRGGGGNGTKPTNTTGGDGGGSSGSGGGKSDSAGKQEGEQSSNLRLPLGISLPLLALGTGWGAWKYCTKRNRGSASKLPILFFCV
ncbi:unnamed protein product [Eruca vesicaria subsp. sativa]|uniref:Malectin-like domain-containing protein n=1 Tax=Eruca vesicaria subsp. sativa TaxID=29727 RepID=A0ABC8LDP4_ERUVS|nr:unnamed protein product [Eruca vesicaria subsp. sativa]